MVKKVIEVEGGFYSENIEEKIIDAFFVRNDVPMAVTFDSFCELCVLKFESEKIINGDIIAPEIEIKFFKDRRKKGFITKIIN